MMRREFIAGIAGAAAWPVAARAQQARMPVIGTLFHASAVEWADNIAGLRRGLAEVDFVEGRNVGIEYRWTDNLDRMAATAADLISRKVAVIVTGGNTEGVRAVLAATGTIPIVFTTALDPVAAGLVGSLNRPGGNATGVTFMVGALVAKQLEILREALPGVTTIAILLNPNNPVMSEDTLAGAQMAAAHLGLEIIVVKAATEHEIEAAFASAVQQGAAALLAEDAYFTVRRKQVAAAGLRNNLPTLSVPQTVAAGALMGYGASIPASYRQAGIYVGRILKGEKPGDLPVQQPTKFDLVINLNTAKALGLTVPPALLARADEVIE
jgi:putative tryptophan/tyrosine transport system substrate-binding protein